MTRRRLYPTVRELAEQEIRLENPFISSEELAKKVDERLGRELRAHWRARNEVR